MKEKPTEVTPEDLGFERISRSDFYLLCDDAYDKLAHEHLTSELRLRQLINLVDKARKFEEHEEFRVLYYHHEETGKVSIAVETKGEFGFFRHEQDRDAKKHTDPE
jgi:hypothetical protein